LDADLRWKGMIKSEVQGYSFQVQGALISLIAFGAFFENYLSYKQRL